MIRLGVVGYGGRCGSIVRGILRKVEPESMREDIRVVGVIDPDRQRVMERLEECDRQDAVFYKTLDEMVRRASLDGLMITTQCNLHTPYAVKAAKYDVPLYLEKPVAPLTYVRSIQRALGVQETEDVADKIGLKEQLQEELQSASPDALRQALAALKNQKDDE